MTRQVEHARAYATRKGWTVDEACGVFHYLEDRKRTLDSAMDKVLLSLSAFAAETEREKAGQ